MPDTDYEICLQQGTQARLQGGSDSSTHILRYSPFHVVLSASFCAKDLQILAPCLSEDPQPERIEVNQYSYP